MQPLQPRTHRVALVLLTALLASCETPRRELPHVDHWAAAAAEADQRRVSDYRFLGIEMFARFNRDGYVLKEHIEGFGDIWVANLGALEPFPVRTIKTDTAGDVMEIDAMQFTASRSEADQLFAASADALRKRMPFADRSDLGVLVVGVFFFPREFFIRRWISGAMPSEMVDERLWHVGVSERRCTPECGVLFLAKSRGASDIDEANASRKAKTAGDVLFGDPTPSAKQLPSP